MSGTTIPKDTIYMFSCAQCLTAQSLPETDDRLKRNFDSKGVFHYFTIDIGVALYHVEKGYYGFSPDRKIFPLKLEEGERLFGKHVCVPTEGKTATADLPSQRDIKKEARSQRNPQYTK